MTLKPIGVTDDGRALILARRAAAKQGAFRLAIDEALVAQLEVARARVRATPPAESKVRLLPRPILVESKLSPREIQALLRRGHSVASIAKKAGVDEAWVERFEGPIVWERAGAAQRAQGSRLTRPRRGTSRLPLGEAVRAHLKQRRAGLTPEQVDDRWDSVRKPKGNRWLVRFTYPSRGRDRVAEWDFDPATGKLTALNDLAAEIGWVEPRTRHKAR